jgi:hypothetical protein
MVRPTSSSVLTKTSQKVLVVSVGAAVKKNGFIMSKRLVER